MATYQLSRWSLADLYPGIGAPELEAAFDQIEEQIASFEGVRGKLNPDLPAEAFLEIVRASEAVARALENRPIRKVIVVPGRIVNVVV